MESSSESTKKFAKRYSKELDKQIIELLENNPLGLNINQISSHLSISRNTLPKYLKALEAKNKIISRKTGVSNLYYKSDIKDGIFPGPYVLTVEMVNNKFKIKKSNNEYAKRLKVVHESLIENDLNDFYPFNEFKTEFDSFFAEALKHLKENHEQFIGKISITNEEEKTETFSFIISPFGEKKNQFSIKFEDLTLLNVEKNQLLNSDSVSKILDLFIDDYVTIQNDDHQVIMANQKTLDDLNNGKELTSEKIFCYDLFRNKSQCENCIGKLAMDNGTSHSDSYIFEGQKYIAMAVPITSDDYKKGYILITKKN